MFTNNSAAVIEEFQHNLNFVFHEAVANNNIDEMDKLINAGADVNSLNNNNESALFVAISNNSIKIYTHLILLHDVDLKLNQQAMILLQLACHQDNLNAFILLHLYKTDIYLYDEEGGTIFHYCAEFNSPRICKYLLDRNHPVDINKMTNNLKWTALHLACVNAHLDVVKLLCAHKNINLNACNFTGYTPFHYACFSDKNIEIVRYLIRENSGVAINSLSKAKYSAFCIACKSKAYKIVEELLKHTHKLFINVNAAAVQQCMMERFDLFFTFPQTPRPQLE